jgi:hypothetical protein
MKKMKGPPAWLLFVGLSCLLGALVLLMMLPANSLGF